MICKIQDNCLSFGHLCFLTTYENEIVLSRVYEYLIHFEYLLLSIHVKCHCKDSQWLASIILWLLLFNCARNLVQLWWGNQLIDTCQIVEHLNKLNYLVDRREDKVVAEYKVVNLYTNHSMFTQVSLYLFDFLNANHIINIFVRAFK